MKEIKLRPRIAKHDLDTKIRHVRRLVVKDKVKVSVVFRGREASHLSYGLNLLDTVIEETKDVAKVSARAGGDKIYFVILISNNDADRTSG